MSSFSLALAQPAAPLWLAAAGFASSLGPCTASRTLALLGGVCAGSRAARLRAALLFAAATVAGDCTVAFASGGARSFVHDAGILNGAIALALLISGVSMLVRNARQCATHAAPRELGALAISGFCSALLIAPCCAPVLFALALFAPPGAMPIDVLAYSLGHLAPVILVACGMGTAGVGRLVARGALPAVRLTGAALCIGAGLLYAVQA